METATSREVLLARMFATLRIYSELAARASPGGATLELPGVRAVATPVAPSHSWFNNVLYTDSLALEEALPTLIGFYQRTGITVWRVWVYASDRRGAAVLDRFGFHRSAFTHAMGLELGGSWRSRPAPRELLETLTTAGFEFVRPTNLREVADLNDRAHSLSAQPFHEALRWVDSRAIHPYLLARAREFVSCGAWFEWQGDAGVFLVATRGDARRLGCARALVTLALAEAADSGCTTSTLQSTPEARELYLGLGYADLGRLDRWEMRIG